MPLKQYFAHYKLVKSQQCEINALLRVLNLPKASLEKAKYNLLKQAGGYDFP